jgi:hypothetical protein
MEQNQGAVAQSATDIATQNQENPLPFNPGGINLEDLDADYYLSILFNIENSPGFKALQQLSISKEVPEDR